MLFFHYIVIVVVVVVCDLFKFFILLSLVYLRVIYIFSLSLLHNCTLN